MPLTLSNTLVVSAHDETGLVAATRAGDDRAFEMLYARYRERIFAFIQGRVHDHGRAEDIAQEVFISALRRLRAGNQEIAFKPWIYEIAKNACIDEFRRGSRSREVPLEPDPELASGGATTLSFLPTPVAAVESKQRMNDLRGAFGGLSPTHHQLLVLREFDGLSYDEIGERLDMTRQMVESGLFRARRKLTEEYQELASGRRCTQVRSAIDAGVMDSARALGLRDRRRFARHLSHCQACRHVALQAGVDEALVRPRSVAARIAAFLPLPLPLSRLRWGGRGPRARGRGGVRAAAGSASHHLASASLQNTAGLVEPTAGSAVVLGRAAAAAATLALAGAGGGLLRSDLGAGHPGRPATTASAAALTQHHAAPSSAGLQTTRALPEPPGWIADAQASVGFHRFSAARPGSSRSHRASPTRTAAKPVRRPATSARGSATSGSGSLPGPAGGLRSAPGSVGHGVSSVGSTAQQAASATNSLGTSTGTTLSNAAGTVTNTPQALGTSTGTTLSNAVGTVTKTPQGLVNGLKGGTSGSSSLPPSSSSSSSAQSAGPSSTSVSGATQVVKHSVQAVGDTAQGLLP
ncbi:MAG TPA: sigma-70 family RNA polymerase sigma factor [Solirubrobacteraceae bacterium]|nr:sigma-70 family RNA polymerase sigma factor [Solirubrobacteraceae bacterium]